MPPRRSLSTNQDADLHQIDTRLRQLQQAEEGALAKEPGHDSSSNTLNAYDPNPDYSPDGSSTLNDQSNFPSGCTTPWDTQLPGRPQIPRSSHSSRIQLRKEEIKTWYQYPRKGYKITTKYFYQEINSSWTAALLVACFFVSGLVDSVAFGVWSVFVGMQTGNTIFLALRISNQPYTHHPLNYLKSLVSVFSYCCGALLFNVLHRAPIGLSVSRVPLHRWTLVVSFIIQSSMLIVVAILAEVPVISSKPFQGGTFSSGTPVSPGDNYLDLLGISLLAFEAAGQVCLSRVLLVNELPTIVLSTLYHDLIGEALGTRTSWRESSSRWDFAVKQKKQIRRVACIISLFAGALVGGFIFQSKAGLSGALWIAAGIKICICIAWCVWPKKILTETVVTRGKDSSERSS